MRKWLTLNLIEMHVKAKPCYSNFTSSCNLKIIHAVISLSNQISDLRLLDDKMSDGKTPWQSSTNPSIMVVSVALAGSTHIFFRSI